MNVLAYDGFQFSDLDDMTGGIEADAQNNWSISTAVAPRGGDVSLLGTGTPSPRIIDVTFHLADVPANDADFWDVFDKLQGRLNPENQSNKRKLIAERPDGTRVWRYARITDPSGWDVDGSINTAVIRFISADPKWYKTTERSLSVFADSRLGTDTSPITWGPNNPAMSLPNTGFAQAHPELSIYTGGVYPGTGGWTYRRSLVITNNLTRTVNNHVALIELGDTSALVGGGKALASGNDLRVIGPDGEEVPRNLVAWNHTGTWMHVYLGTIAPGDAWRGWIVYGNSAAGSPLTLTYPYMPAWRIDCVAGTVIGAGSTTTVIHFTAGSIVPFPSFSPTSDIADFYKDGVIYFTSGANAGVGRLITANVWNGGAVRHEFTVSSAFPNAPTSTDDWVIITSRNGKWLYGTKNDVERGFSNERGRWYINSNEGYPSIVDYDVPGAWKPALYYDGRDRKGNPGYTRITNAGDADPYAIMNVYRTYENANVVIPEDGGADGVSLSLPMPITGYDWSGTLINPNGMAKGVVGVRSFGGNDFAIVDSLDTVGASTAWNASPSIPAGTNQIYHGLIPYEGEEITQKWRKDSGSSTTTGTTTTINDSTKAWRTNQWVGYYARLTNGKKAGTLYAISANTATQLTVASMGVSSPANLSYEIVGADLFARLYDGSRCTVTWDDADLDISAIGTEEFCTDLSARFWIGGGKSSSSVLAGHARGSLEVGKDPDSFVLVKDSSFYHVVADSRLRSAIQYDAIGGNIIERYTPPRVEWLGTDEDGLESASMNGLPIPPNLDNVITNPSAAVSVGSWSFATEAGLTGQLQRSTTRYAGYNVDGTQIATSFQIVINSNIGGPLSAYATCDDRFPIQAGGLAQFATFVRSSNTAYRPLLGIKFYDALSGGSLISSDYQAATAYTINTWYAEGFASEAPVGALSWSPVIRCYIATGAALSDIFFTAVDPASPVLFMQSDHDIGRVDVAYTETYLQ